MRVKIISKRKWIGEEGHVKQGQLLHVDIKRARHLVESGAAEFATGPAEKKSSHAPIEFASLPVAPVSFQPTLINSDQHTQSLASTTPTDSAVTLSTHVTGDGGEPIKRGRGRPPLSAGRGTLTLPRNLD